MFLYFLLFTVVTLKRIDFTGNIISEIEDGAFAKLTMLEELSLAENQLAKLPMLPAKLSAFNANHNKLKTKGVKANAFKVSIASFCFVFFAFFMWTNSFLQRISHWIALSKRKTASFVNISNWFTLLPEIKQTATSVSCSQWTGGRSSHSRDRPHTSSSG